MPILLEQQARKVLNNLSRDIDKTVLLGDIVDSMIDRLGDTGTPVNAVAAKATLTFSGVVIHGEKVTIHNPLAASADVYEFLADVAQAVSSPDNIPVDISDKATAASGTLTMAAQPTSGDTVTIGTKVYTFVPVGTANADGEVSIGADLAGAQAALRAAVNGTDEVNDPHPLVSMSAFETNVSTITAFIAGTAGNAIATTETFASVSNLFAAVALSLGTDCPAADAIEALVAAVVAEDNQSVGAVAGESSTILFTADLPGAAGNQISVAETLANGTFGAGVVALSGGVNGTVSDGITVLVDASYIYICPEANTINDQKWRRVSISSY